MAEWKVKLEKEFQMAASARARGNEGQARVCARRAAGIAVREYLTRRGDQTATLSAFDLLNILIGLPDIDAEARRAAEYLTVRVNEEFKLPVDADLIREARALCEKLMPGEGGR